MFEQFVQYVLGEVRLIAQAPLVFGAAVLFLGAIIWAALRWRYDDGTVAGRKAVMGALTLYLDFINLFLFLLRFLGDRR